jgi:hypothetical protein
VRGDAGRSARELMGRRARACQSMYFYPTKVRVLAGVPYLKSAIRPSTLG